MKRLTVLALALFVVGACSSYGPKQGLGGLTGAALGGWAGSTIGGGDGRLAATAAGTVLGLLLGSGIGESLDRVDALYASRATSRALEIAPTGAGISWRNPDSGNYGTVAPVRTYQRSNGQYCREFQSEIIVGGKIQQGYGTACRQPDGSWKMVSTSQELGPRTYSQGLSQVPYAPPARFQSQSSRTQQHSLLRGGDTIALKCSYRSRWRSEPRRMYDRRRAHVGEFLHNLVYGNPPDEYENCRARYPREGRAPTYRYRR